MKKILLGILALITAIVAGLYFYVANMDWNKHKGRMVQQVMNTTGKKIVFDGKVNFSLLPSPYLEARDVKLYNREGTSVLAEIPNMVAELQLLPLLQGSLQITSMSLENSKLNFRISEEGKLNWEENESINDYSSDSEKLELSSVMLKNSQISVEDKLNKYSFNMENVTAEVSAESMRGPYRMEGNFARQNETFGFIFAMGSKNEGYATPINLAVIHAPTESYIRFDGTYMAENNALSGGIMAESKDPIFILGLIDENLVPNFEIKEPLVISSEIRTNKTRLDLSNFVIKYGQNIGAGNIVVPLAQMIGSAQNRRKPKIEAVFEMTDLDLDTIKMFAKDKTLEIWNSDAPYKPDFAYDLVLDVKAVKTLLNGYELQNFVAGFEVINNMFVLKNLSLLAPGNTKIASRGRMYPEGEKLTYNLDFVLVTDDFQKMANWLGYDPKIIVPATYKSAQIAMNASGTPKNMKITPLKIGFDKINVEAEVSYIADTRKTWSVKASTDNVINLDNYLVPLPENYMAESVIEKMLFRFKELGFLESADLFVDLSMPGIIMDKTAYGKTDFSAELINGKMEIKNLKSNNFYEANITASGMLSGFGKAPVFEKMNYTFEVDDFSAFMAKIDSSYKGKANDINKLNSRGVISGSFENLQLKAISDINDIECVYDGTIVDSADNAKTYAGDLSIKAPDFAKFMEDFFDNKNYGFINKALFTLDAQISGTANKFRLMNTDILVGVNTIKGNVDVDLSAEKAKISGDVHFNNIDLSQLLYDQRDISDKSFSISRGAHKSIFIEKPYLDSAILNYDVFDGFEYSGKVAVDRLTYNSIIVTDASADVEIADKKITAKEIKSVYHGANVNGLITLDRTKQKDGLSGNLSFSDMAVSNLGLDGSVYGIMGGNATVNTAFRTNFNSVATMYSQLNADVSFDMNDVTLKGWSLLPIYNNLKDREESKGLTRFVSENMNRNTTSFKSISGSLVFEPGKFYTPKEANISMIADNYVVSSEISGDLSEWTINDVNVVSFPNLKEMPNMTITCAGSMDKPSCSADIQAISDKYDNYWQQLAQERADRQAAAEKKIKDALLAENDKLRPLKDDLENNLMPELQNHIDSTKKKDLKREYASALEQAKYVYESVNYLLALENKEKVSSDELEFAKGKYDVYAQSVQQIRDKISKMSEESAREDYTLYYDSIIDVYKTAKIKVMEYRADINRNILVGAQMFPPVDFLQDKEFVESRKNVENDYVAIDGIYSKVMQEFYGTERNLKLDEVEDYNRRIHELNDNAKNKLQEMANNIDASLNLMKEMLTKAQNTEENATKENAENQNVAEEEKKEANVAAENKKSVTETKKEKEKPTSYLRSVSGEIKKLSGKVRRADEDEKEPEPEVAEQKPSFLRAIVGEIKGMTGNITKKEE